MQEMLSRILSQEFETLPTPKISKIAISYKDPKSRILDPCQPKMLKSALSRNFWKSEEMIFEPRIHAPGKSQINHLSSMAQCLPFHIIWFKSINNF